MSLVAGDRVLLGNRNRLVLSIYGGDIAPTVIEAINKIGSVFYGPILAIFLLAILFDQVHIRSAQMSGC